MVDIVLLEAEFIATNTYKGCIQQRINCMKCERTFQIYSLCGRKKRFKDAPSGLTIALTWQINVLNNKLRKRKKHAKIFSYSN